jgi:hypothetical protein
MVSESHRRNCRKNQPLVRTETRPEVPIDRGEGSFAFIRGLPAGRAELPIMQWAVQLLSVCNVAHS